MFVNYSNHPSSGWEDTQISAALKYGSITVVHFPVVPADCDEDYIQELAEKEAEIIIEMLDEESAVMVQGEFTLTYALVKRLKQAGIRVVSACTERNVINKVDENGDVIKEVRFHFTRFREY